MSRVVSPTEGRQIATALERIRCGTIHYLTKPTDVDRMLSAFHHGLASRPSDLRMATCSASANITATDDVGIRVSLKPTEVSSPSNAGV